MYKHMLYIGIVLSTLVKPHRVDLIKLTGEVDAYRLKAHADSQFVPEKLVYGIAWMETRSGESGNKARGPGILKQDTIGYHPVYTKSPGGSWAQRMAPTLGLSCRVCREIGRMQLNPCVNWKQVLRDPRCTLKHITDSYDDNVYCGIKNMRRLNLEYGTWSQVPLHYNGAAIYQRDMETYIGHITMKELS